MAQVTLNIPDELVGSQQETPEDFAHRLQLAAAIYWYARGEISQGKAAQLAGMNRQEFLATLAREKIDVFQIDFDDLRQELARS
ncbi:MAG: UPF0175 family protein [Thermosynechococcaceae cyanobacterium]